MPIYDYRAYNTNGKVYTSSFESASLVDAKAKLFEQGIAFVSLKEGKRKKSKRVSKSSLLLFTEQLCELLQADLPLFESLEFLKEQFNQDAFYPVLDTLSESLRMGMSFSDALKQLPEHFDILYCTLAEMGEQSGHLAEALKRVSMEISKSCQLQKRLRSALIYPSMLAVFCAAVMVVLMFYVIPSIESLFEKSTMGSFTKNVIGFCHHMKHWLLAYILIVASFVVITRALLKIPQYKKKLDQLILLLPKVNRTVIDFELSKWTSTVALLLKGEVPLINALDLAENLISNTLLKEALSRCRKKVSEGNKLSIELNQHTFFSPIIKRIIAIGENSGDLVSSFGKLSYLLEDSIDKKLNKFMTLLAPVSLMIMAALIGIIMLAILIPLTDINSLLG